MNAPDKYETAKAEISTIYHENKGRYGYRRITMELHKRNIRLNHKTVQRLMKELGLVCRVRMKKYHPGCMLDRNRWMVDHASVLLAVYNGTQRSGTGATVNYAQRQHQEIIIIDPISRQITYR